MKLHELIVRNFRALRDVTIRPAQSGVTVIEGRNEVGKSSLGEALRMLLEVKDRSKSQQVKNVIPADSGSAPEIRAELSSGPFRFSYYKRFSSKPKTTLQIMAPEPASLHGDEAHERVQAMLGETMDAELWAALQMEQGGSHVLADLTQQSALSSALDQAAAGSSGDGRDEDLFSQVEAIYFEFYTRRAGQPEGKALKDLRAEVDQLKERLTALDDEQRLLEDQVTQARTLALELAEREQSMGALRSDYTEQQRQLEAALALHQSVTQKTSELTLARAQRDTAKLALQGRTELVDRLTQNAAELQTLLEQSAAAQPALQAAQDAATDCAARLTDARLRRDAAADNERKALAAQTRVSQARELAELRRRQSEWKEIAARMAESRNFLAVCKVTTTLLQRAREADLEYRRLLEQSRSSAPELQITAMAPLALEEEGTVTDLAAGESARAALKRGETVSIRNVATLEIVTGENQSQRDAAAEKARRELRAALEAMDVSGTAQAEQQLDARARHEERLKALEEQRASVLGGASAEDIEARIARLAADCAGIAQSAGDTGDEHEKHARAAREKREAAEETVRREEQALSQSSALKDSLERTQLERALQTEARRSAIATLTGQLDKDRQETSDESLEKRLSELDSALQHREAALKEAQAAAAQLPLEQAQDSADTAQRVLAEAGNRLSECQMRLAELRSALRVREEKGLYEARASAAAALELASVELDSKLHQARAARLLYETLSAARQRQRSRYLLPMASKMEELGRVVFGESFRVSLDDDLGIASRTLDGITVPFSALSVGAREQISVLQRVATALCVDENDGVPLILDDVLGHADPLRLRAMNAVLGLAGRRTQVIITTCYPERYRHIDRALTITLP